MGKGDRQTDRQTDRRRKEVREEMNERWGSVHRMCTYAFFDLIINKNNFNQDFIINHTKTGLDASYMQC